MEDNQSLAELPYSEDYQPEHLKSVALDCQILPSYAIFFRLHWYGKLSCGGKRDTTHELISIGSKWDIPPSAAGP